MATNELLDILMSGYTNPATRPSKQILFFADTAAYLHGSEIIHDYLRGEIGLIYFE